MPEPDGRDSTAGARGIGGVATSWRRRACRRQRRAELDQPTSRRVGERAARLDGHEPLVGVARAGAIAERARGLTHVEKQKRRARARLIRRLERAAIGFLELGRSSELLATLEVRPCGSSLRPASAPVAPMPSPALRARARRATTTREGYERNEWWDQRSSSSATPGLVSRRGVLVVAGRLARRAIERLERQAQDVSVRHAFGGGMPLRAATDTDPPQRSAPGDSCAVRGGGTGSCWCMRMTSAGDAWSNGTWPGQHPVEDHADRDDPPSSTISTRSAWGMSDPAT